MKKITSILVFLLLGSILAAGCTGPASPAATVTGTPVAVSTPVAGPITTPAVAEPVPTEKRIRSDPPRTPEVTVTTTPQNAIDDPFTEYLNIRKRTFDSPLPNCYLQTAFPGLLKENYGLRQVEPNLVMISEDDYLTFIRKNTEGNAENSQLKTPAVCQGTAADPTWNFIEVRIILEARNVHANTYTITQEIVSNGKVVAKFPTTRRLSLGDKVTLVGYIPMKSDEVNQFDDVELTYIRL
jgi:hypothetical protein